MFINTASEKDENGKFYIPDVSESTRAVQKMNGFYPSIIQTMEKICP